VKKEKLEWIQLSLENVKKLALNLVPTKDSLNVESCLIEFSHLTVIQMKEKWPFKIMLRKIAIIVWDHLLVHYLRLNTIINKQK